MVYWGLVRRWEVGGWVSPLSIGSKVSRSQVWAKGRVNCKRMLHSKFSEWHWIKCFVSLWEFNRHTIQNWYKSTLIDTCIIHIVSKLLYGTGHELWGLTRLVNHNVTTHVTTGNDTRDHIGDHMRPYMGLGHSGPHLLCLLSSGRGVYIISRNGNMYVVFG